VSRRAPGAWMLDSHINPYAVVYAYCVSSAAVLVGGVCSSAATYKPFATESLL
jgi:hypothetical protein